MCKNIKQGINSYAFVDGIFDQTSLSFFGTVSYKAKIKYLFKKLKIEETHTQENSCDVNICHYMYMYIPCGLYGRSKIDCDPKTI